MQDTELHVVAHYGHGGLLSRILGDLGRLHFAIYRAKLPRD